MIANNPCLQERHNIYTILGDRNTVLVPMAAVRPAITYLLTRTVKACTRQLFLVLFEVTEADLTVLQRVKDPLCDPGISKPD